MAVEDPRHQARLDPLIIPAAGRSTRMGQPKGLLVVDGLPLLAWQIERYRMAGGDRAVVVVAPGQENGAYAELARSHGAAVAVSLAAEHGPYASLLAGLSAVAALDHDAEGAYFLPLDVPGPHPGLWRSLASSSAGRKAAVPVDAAGRGGHPVWLARAFWSDLSRIPLESTEARLDVQLRSQGQAVQRVVTSDPSIHVDLNTPADWQRWIDGRPARD